MVSAQNEMEKALRDKVTLINDLENAKLQIRRYDKEVSLVMFSPFPIVCNGEWSFLLTLYFTFLHFKN